MRVRIDDLSVSALRILPDRWNGHAVPVFDEETVMFLRDLTAGDEVEGEWEHVGDGWVVHGWCWLEDDYSF
jgi:hypothetical protein